MNTKAYSQLLSKIEEMKLAKDYSDIKDRYEGPISPTVITAISNCITNRWRLYMYYIGDKETKPGYRWVEPYCYGLSKYTGNTLLRAYQYKGTTTTDEPAWKTYRLDRIRTTAVLSKTTFNTPRPEWNPDGDLLMSTVIQMITFPEE